MSLFDLPRINVKGTMSVSPATANNDDMAASVTMPSSWGPFAGAPLALIDSKLVRANTYGMSDANFIAWVQQVQPFAGTQPAEWNYYGDHTTDATGKVVGVQGAANSLAGATLAFSGGLCDVNSEGSPPATQFFIDELTLKGSDGTTLIAGRPSKGACQWLNFYRNVNLTQDGGAGGYVYHTLLKSAPGTVINIPELQDSKIIGVILRYCLFRILQGNPDYANQKPNPAELEFVATIAPLYADEDIRTGPVGRLLISNTTQIATPPNSQNNGNNGLIALAPTVLQQRGNKISVDFSPTFPDNYNGTTNLKYDFGPVRLVTVNGNSVTPIADVDYADTDAGDARGWIFDFDIDDAVDPNATFALLSEYFGFVLRETDYYFVSNQQGIYAEQFGAGDRFLNQGTEEPATVSVYRRGVRLDRSNCPPITVWQYRSVPLQSPGNAAVNAVNVLPGDPISVDTAQPGNYLLTFTVNDDNNPAPGGYPPASYLTFQNPPWLTNAPSISLRILPNDEDFSRYYVDPEAKEPVGNELLTFNVLYEKVLRTYYVLYPAMSNQAFALNSESAVKDHAKGIIDRTDMKHWMTTKYMPRTRDLSASRKTLLQAWCRKVK